MGRGRTRWGTSSWSEKSWVGPFYPAGTKQGDFLPYYATRFDTVEADNTYYRIPSERMVTTWRARLPDGFSLAAKFPRSVVHAGDGPRPDAGRVIDLAAVRDDVELFLERMALLGEKCGPLVLQFPYFNRAAFATRDPFLDRLRALLAFLPDGFRYAVELRNKAWIDEVLLDVLRTHGTALVWADLSYMPHPAEGVPETYVYANNHYAGHGPATIRQLQGLVEGGECGKENPDLV